MVRNHGFKSKILRVVWVATLLVTANLPLWGAVAAPAKRPSAPLDLTTSPLPITLAAKPGASVSTTIKVKQSGGNTEQLRTRLLKFGAYGEEGKPRLSERGPGDDYFDWVTFDKPTFTAPNDVWQEVKMTIKLPKTAAFEYNYAVEFTRVGDELSPGGNQSGIAGGTAVLVLLDAQAPGEKRSLNLESFSVKHRVVEFLPTTFSAKFYNNGNVFIQPGGNIFVSQGKHIVGNVLLNDQKGNILAGSRRIYKAEWGDGFPFYEPSRKQGKPALDRHGNEIQTLNWNLPTNAEEAKNAVNTSTTNVTMEKESTNPLSRIRFGLYTARLVAVYSDGFGRDVPVISEVKFWVIPWRILLAFLVILLVFGFAGYTIVRNILRRSKRVQRLSRRRR
jgi:hypothetical protein